ncbi:hypothetical protein E1B28_011032 [Marasmius oreades]|uniref:Zn(2)-C6 fungal-type domain-containing protein n=1 Tax=Marasmius oreades TaxID=181124 RepID=A0A9P7UQS8_9AGAR|nr:uncharacterized protein E1B28_011032 [Marasmius oreades]KAG7089341.1 hypothetical protein E1B28_011032 [Marasmius oreades]
MTSTTNATILPRRLQQAPPQGQPRLAPYKQQQLQSSVADVSSTSNAGATTADSEETASGTGEAAGDGGKKKKTTKRRKVNHACLYCRRSHMTCDDGRPCQRCIKREIGHLCHDERRSRPNEKAEQSEDASPTTVSTTATIPGPSGTVSYSSLYNAPTQTQSYVSSSATWPTSVNSQTSSFLYRPDIGNEFSVLTDFLETLDDSSFFAAPSTVAPSLMSTPATNGFGGPNAFSNFNAALTPITQPSSSSTSPVQSQPLPQSQSALQPQSTTESSTSPENKSSSSPAPPLPSDSLTKTEKFLLTAADQEDGSRDERLNRVIRSKYEAGLLKPYNYVKGYARLSRWMDRNVSQESKHQILQPLSVLRPKFRAVAQSLRDMDLVLIEEAFERLLLDYDRVFSAMGVPACLWRRTGEIYKANREFCELVGVQGALMREVSVVRVGKNVLFGYVIDPWDPEAKRLAIVDLLCKIAK